jgi:hypothetical protein
MEYGKGAPIMRKLIILSIVAGLMFCVAIALTTQDAWAIPAADKKSTIGKDKEIAGKEGVAGSLGKKQWDKDKLPTKLKLAFGFGSLFAGIAVFKWL